MHKYWLFLVILVSLCWSARAAVPEDGNYAFSFRARSAVDADQVQIWAGFRIADRFDRYMVGIKGGEQDDVYLMRQGYMGMDELMGVRPLGFHPLPGQWYRVKVEACGARIRVFVGDEPLPYIDVTDPDWQLAPSGPVELGGGWIETEYADLQIVPLDSHALDGVGNEELSFTRTRARKRSCLLRIPLAWSAGDQPACNLLYGYPHLTDACSQNPEGVSDYRQGCQPLY